MFEGSNIMVDFTDATMHCISIIYWEGSRCIIVHMEFFFFFFFSVSYAIVLWLMFILCFMYYVLNFYVLKSTSREIVFLLVIDFNIL